MENKENVIIYTGVPMLLFKEIIDKQGNKLCNEYESDILTDIIIQEYAGYNMIILKTNVDDIFMGRFNTTLFLDDITKKQLGYIEPYYGLVSDMLYNMMERYVNRYGIDYTSNNKDILTNQTIEVKRLFRCIDRK